MVGRSLETSGHFVRAGQRYRARRQVGRGADNIGKRIEQIADRGAQAVGTTGENALELLQLVVPRRVAGGDGFHQCGLLGQEVAVVALNRGDVNTVAVVAATGELAFHVLDDDGLARVARRVDVGNVVADGLKNLLVDQQGPCANVQDVAHALFPQAVARCRRSVVLMARLSLLA